MAIDLTALPEAVQKALAGVDVEKGGLSQEVVSALVSALSPEAPAEPVAPEAAAEPAEAVTEDVGKADATDDDKGDEPEEEPVAKSADFVALQKALDEERAQREALTKGYNELVEKAAIRDKTDEVRKTYPAFAAKAEALATSLYRIEKGAGTAEDATLIAELLGTASAAVKESSLFKEEGSAREEGDKAPADVIETIARKLMTEDAQLTMPQAVAKAVRTPEGRAAYAEQAADRRL